MNRGARPLRSTRRLANFTTSMPKWYSIVRNQAGPTMVSIYDEIGFFGVSAADFMAELSQIQGDIELHLNSPGGDVFDGIAIHNQLRSAQQRGQVHVIIDGLAASAASFIAMAASPGKLEMAPHSRMMIHDGFAMAIGNAADMRQTADLLDDASDNIASMYAERSGKPAAYWRDKMQAETWFSGEQAVAEGLADGIHGQDPAPKADWDLSVYAHAGVSNAATVVVNADGNHAPMSGSHAHSHPAYGAQGDDTMHSHEHSHDGDAHHEHHGSASATDKIPFWVRNGTPMHGDHERVDPDNDGDCDACAEGDTDHDYWSEDGKQIKQLPGQGASAKAGFPALNADVDNSPWDASKAWHNGATADDPAAFYKGICAGRKAGDPDNQSSWALPYKYHPGDAPNAAGVRAALGRLPQTDGLTNAEEARSLLQRLMKQVNPDYEPDDVIDPGLLAAAFTAHLDGGK